MSESFFPPAVLTLVTSTGDTVAQMAKVTAVFEETGAAIVTSMAEAGTATEAMGAKVAATEAELQATNERALRSFAALSAQVDRSAEQMYVSMAGMAAKTQASLAELEAAEARAAKATEAFGASMDASAARAEVASGRWGAIKKGALLVGAGALVAGGELVHMAADFETATNKLLTSAGESHDAIGMVRDGLLSMAGQVGVSADDLAKALYKVESAGYHGGAGLGLLKAAEQGAKAEGADATTVADALSSAMRDYYPAAKSAAEVTTASTDVMSKLIGATSAGKMTFDELAGALNSILPVSSAAKISLSDTLGVLASMTVHGISAQQATQNMADAVRHLQGAGQSLTMSKAMATIGVDSVDVAAKLGERGLAGTMQYLSDKIKHFMPPGSDKVILELGTALSKSTPKVQELGHKVLDGTITMKQFSGELKTMDPLSAKQAQSFATLAARYHQLGTQQLSGAEVMATYSGMLQQVMGDATGLKVALMTTGDNAQYTSDAIKTVSGSTADASGNVKGWADVQDTFNQKLAQAKEGFGAMAIAIGQKLMPIASKIIGVFATMAHWFGEHKWAATALAVVLGGALVIGLAAATAAAWKFTVALLANPTTWIALEIGVLIAAIVLLATHWNQVWGAIQTVAGAAWNWLNTNIFRYVGIIVETFIVAPFKNFVHFWVTRWDKVSSVAETVWSWIEDHIFHPIQVGLGAIGSAVAWLGEVWDRIWHAMGAAIEWVYDNTIKPVVDKIHDAVSLAQVMMGIKQPERIAGTPVAVPGFDEGGWVPGPLGQPLLSVVHGGEFVVSHDMMAGRGGHSASSPTMPAAASGRGGNVTVINLNVAGTVVAERDFHQLMQRVALRYGQRNTGSGLNFGVA